MPTLKRQKADGTWEYIQLTGLDISQLQNSIQGNTDTIAQHQEDDVRHITADERTYWNSKGNALSANGQLHVPNQSFIKLGTDTLQTVESGVDVKLTPVERVDRRGEYDATTHRFIPLESGLYSFTGKFNFSANTTSYSYFKIYKNGVLFDTIYTGYGYKLAHISGIFELPQSGSDYYEFYVRHTTTGGAQNTETQLEITKLS